MATTPTPEEAVERARRAQDQRIETVRVLAQSRQELTNERESADRERTELEARLKERMREYEAADVKAFSAATSAGWTPEELRRIGFPEPEKKRRARRRSTARPKQQKTDSGEAKSSTSESAEPVPDEQSNGSSPNV
ncbi:hypothetical protein [Brachybacterium alimentarium]|uniref:hypothetical protein n=1 Tax=Brachybacterium alimentarium TaxID=47845 RepID=UPI003FD40632